MTATPRMEMTMTKPDSIGRLIVGGRDRGRYRLYADGMCRIDAPGWDIMTPAQVMHHLVEGGVPQAEAAEAKAMLTRAIGRFLAHLESGSPIFATAQQDTSGVWWVASLAYETTGRPVEYRASDEGGAHPQRYLAEAEAEERAQRMAARHQIFRTYDVQAVQAEFARRGVTWRVS